ncbi:TetR/AcrR family transcriptional regulator [Pseudomonas sp. GW456-E7]|uniref:TetR family transcriptional regulator n=1 Tax=Pseudomonas fluorescens HK44 TaxID=1042209 RepID=A0A010RNE2_PSEFL|nr:TetR/AcrR family transcriptional regulator [Pseudomonas fluorescens]EXF94036.1 TetR family transcriptional regulator [Pseudomonas fluorescens HK44]PNB75518.1 TetR/AcrR family transcriptional regulator [Pseudomonas sp. GW456-E7]
MNVATSSPVDDLLNPGESASRPVRILAAAGRMFIEHGYEGASMEEIAKAAAVTRQTLYNRFPEGKESLFVAVAERMWKAFPVMHVPTDERALADPRNGLMQIATEFACFWSGPTAADFLRMVFMEGRRFPVLAYRFDEVIQGPAMTVISDYLAELARRGILAVQVPETDARYFMETLNGGVLLKQIRANSEPLAREEIEQIVERTVDAFLRSLRH